MKVLIPDPIFDDDGEFDCFILIRENFPYSFFEVCIVAYAVCTVNSGYIDTGYIDTPLISTKCCSPDSNLHL